MKSHLLNHVLTVHEKLRPFTCVHCGRAFGLKCNWRSHLRAVHMKGNGHACGVGGCPAVFSRRHDVKMHRQQRHGVTDERGAVAAAAATAATAAAGGAPAGRPMAMAMATHQP